MYYNRPFYSLIFIPVSSYQQNSSWNGVGIVAFTPSILPKCVMAFPKIIIIATELPEGNGATEVNLLPFLCYMLHF